MNRARVRRRKQLAKAYEALLEDAQRFNSEGDPRFMRIVAESQLLLCDAWELMLEDPDLSFSFSITSNKAHLEGYR